MPSLPSPPPSPSPSQNPDRPSFEQDLEAVERSLQDLKARHAQVQQDEAQQTQLQHRRDRLQPQLQSRSQPQLKAELEQIQTQLDELEIQLESRLFSWQSLREPFWQIVRFGGVGLAIGWALAFIVIKSPQPNPPAALPNVDRGR